MCADNSRFKLANAEDIPEGKGIVVDGPEDEEIALYKLNGEIFALDNECPHMGGPLGEGTIENGVVTCPWHMWQFHINTGECCNPEEMPRKNATKLNIAVEGNEVFLISSQ